MRRLLAAFLLPILLAVPAGCEDTADEPPTVESVLQRFVDAVGGRERFEELDQRHYAGTIVQDLSWSDPTHTETPFLAQADAAGAVRYGEVTTWAELPSAKSTDLRSKLRWILHPRYALVVEEFFPDLVLTGRQVREGRPVLVLAPADLPYEYYALYFDEETGLLAHVGYHNDIGDWRRVDGVLYPHRWVFGRKGGHTTYVFEKVGTGPGGD